MPDLLLVTSCGAPLPPPGRTNLAMSDPTALAAAAIPPPTAPRPTRAEPVVVAVGTLIIGPSALPGTSASTSPLAAGQDSAAEGAGVGGFVVLVAQGLGVAGSSFVGAAVGVVASALSSAVCLLPPVVLARRYVAGGGVLRVPVSVEPPPVACVEVAL